MSKTRGPDTFLDPAFPARIRACEPRALEATVKAYLSHILRAARGAGLNEEQARDSTQEVFKTFIETAERFEGRSHIRTWLFGILYHKISEARRNIAKKESNEDIDDMLEKRFDEKGMWSRPPVEADSATWRREIAKHIEDCMEPLPETQRLSFHLREVEDCDSEEICKILDVSRTNLGVLLYRARNSLRECLEEKGVER